MIYATVVIILYRIILLLGLFVQDPLGESLYFFLENLSLNVCVCVCVFIYMYIYYLFCCYPSTIHLISTFW
ncbi:hypothetical protein F4703DRAFT_1842713 [Phycomyces blakesleeanus]